MQKSSFRVHVLAYNAKNQTLDKSACDIQL